MTDTTQKLIEMESRIRELSAEVSRLRDAGTAPRRRFTATHAGLALALGFVLATMPFATGAQNAPVEERVRALEQKLIQPLTLRAPFQVTDAAGKLVMRAEISSGVPILTVGDPAAAGATLGVGNSGAGFVLVRGAGGVDGAAVGQYKGAGMGLHVVASDGQTVQGSLSLNSVGKGQLAVGDEKTGGAVLAVGKSGAGGMILRRSDGKDGIVLGQLEGRPMSVGVFGENNKELVSLRTDAKGGTVRVMGPTGVSVGGLMAGDNGGSVELTAPLGGKSAVSISVQPSGGKVRVFAAGGGPAQAELTAEASGGGAMTLYTTSGAPSALLQTGNGGGGRLEISRAGTIYVEAGIGANGRGVVRAGPTVGGPPIGALGFADTIMGKVK